MAKDRSKEIAELQEKVFGAGSPTRTFFVSADDMMNEARQNEKKINTVSEHSASARTNLDDFRKSTQNLQKSLSEQLAQLKRQTGLSVSDGDTTVDLSKLQAEIKRDFGVDVDMQQDGTFVEKAVVSSHSFSGVTEQLTNKVIGQDAFCDQLTVAFKRPYVLKNKGDHVLNTILLMGPKGTGKTYALEQMAQILAQKQILADASIASVDLSRYTTADDEKLFLQDIYSAIAEKGQIIHFVHAENCFPAYLVMIQEFFIEGKISLHKRYYLKNGQLVDAGNALLSTAVQAIEANNHFLVFETSLSRVKLIDLMGAQFVNSFADVVETKASPSEDIARLAQRFSADLVQQCAQQFGLNLEVTDSAQNYLLKTYIPKQGAYSLQTVTKRVFDALTDQLLKRDDTGKNWKLITDKERLMLEDEAGNRTDVYLVTTKDQPADLAEIQKELDAIVGLKQVKQYVLSLKDNYEIQKIREQKGLKTSSVSRHMIFTGNPGTGKTTIARIIAKYLRALGVLSGGQLVEVTRADLVGQYVGHTAPLTMKVIRSAVGGVLFIDEAYSLYRGKDDSFGLECIDTLVKGIEDYRDDLIVILAGYEKEMETFLTANTGLKSRFPNIINFPDYTPEELVEISHSIATGKDYVIVPECDQHLLAYYTKMQSATGTISGNGRTARNKVEEAILRQSQRLLKNPEADMRQLLPEDFNLSDTSFVE